MTESISFTPSIFTQRNKSVVPTRNRTTFNTIAEQIVSVPSVKEQMYMKELQEERNFEKQKRTFSDENKSLFDEFTTKFADTEMEDLKAEELGRRHEQLANFKKFRVEIERHVKVIKEARDLIKARVWAEMKRQDEYKLVNHHFNEYGITLQTNKLEDTLKADFITIQSLVNEAQRDKDSHKELY